MPVAIELKTRINPSTIYAMRNSGATLWQIADKIGRTQERVRQILIKNYGSTKHKLISTEQLCKLSGLSRHRVIKLYQDGAITTVKEWYTSTGNYLLWLPATIGQINAYNSNHRLCRMCGHPIYKGRLTYCSEECLEEGRKYKNRSFEAKQRHLRNVRRYRERRKQLVD